MGFTGNGRSKITPEKLKSLETYARGNLDKWYTMSYYLQYVEEMVAAATVGGVLCLAFRHAGACQ
ncbi:hypothetical protein GN244_ATG16684 [Phytophthora infestans]|uniref:Uncharacterized protein n=1 Tax=Phytophthora infestans TaxID=4787 RepID=A0A833SSP4_PHYIN|nr:hypothetical protein GN244_ATG19558 [Phytophthora infestans]KAF4031454.1 hypothetical protein GN244_ATG16684 [Phytophthora infestans]KAF4135114.1 hypothetical protein GN958_ATG15674 [Phytophthora infestans]